jgi:phosphoglucomutase
MACSTARSASAVAAGKIVRGRSFIRRDGGVWTTDKDRIVRALPSAEITARIGRDPGEIYHGLVREFGEPIYHWVEVPATPERKQKQKLAQLSPRQGRAGWRKNPEHPRPGSWQRAPIGGPKVIAGSGWFAARPSGTGDIGKIYAESFRGGDHLRRILAEAQAIVGAALAAPMQQPEIPSRTNLQERR